jgi:hypothetical protein
MLGFVNRLKERLKELRKVFSEPYFKIGILVFLISLLSFGIGYIAGRDWTPAPIVIEKHSG